MNRPSVLWRTDDERLEPAAPPQAEPKVFSKTISTPPGAPWDQARAAGLEARVAAPLPLGEVVYRLRRLEAWTPGRPARHAAFYVRARDVGEGFETTVQVDGRHIKVSFLSPAEQARRARRSLMLFSVAAAAGLLLFVAVAAAIAGRVSTEARLSALEQTAAARVRAAKAYERLKVQTRLLNAAGARGSSLADYLADLAWATAAKAPAAHIDALHWQHGYMGVEVRGDAAPFAAPDRTVIKADRPIRPGLWLYGVAPAARGSAVSAARPSAQAAGVGP
ncbi:MAG: hypothetical protein P4L73_05235 [Caulobacteraceae bacterium]|nr:hypothetical protein [Caulobacteraceae bacterium]